MFFLLESDRSGNLFVTDILANKLDIKRDVEKKFGVHVVKVNTLRSKGKKKRERSMKYGQTARWKKAIVTLQEGETIELS